VADATGKLDPALCDPVVGPPLTEGREFGPESVWNVWTNFTYTDIEDTRGNSELDVNDSFFEIGIDRLVQENLVLGLQLEYENTQLDGFQGQFSQDTSGFAIGPYFAWRMSERWVLNGLATIGRFSTDVDVLELSGDFDRTRWRANLEAIGQYEAGAYLIRPSISFDYYNYSAEDYDLTGTYLGNPAEFIGEVQEAKYSALTPEVEVSRPFLNGSSVISPYASLSATYWFERENLGGGTVANTDNDVVWSTRLGVRGRTSKTVFLEASIGYLDMFESDFEATEAAIFLSVNF
jgi:hypothetical protein